MGNHDLEMRDAKTLATGYSRWFRLVEVVSIALFFSLMIAVASRALPYFTSSPWLLLTAIAVGFVLADFVSGLVHWAADTWASVDTPFIGKALLRPFREHHVDPKAMTRHDYIETNGANCLIALPVAATAALMPASDQGWGAVGLFAMATTGSMIFWVMLTNQIHKWAHCEPKELLAPVRWAQRLHLILPPAHHDRHHTPPFDQYYCITTGWLNWALTKLSFYRVLETVVTALTGAIPRRDDIGLKAALASAPAVPTASSSEARTHP